jgi:glycerol-3-phosphate dehydrogenase
MQRNEILNFLKTKPEIDVLIIGAGINGAGTFRDLALNDVNVLLIDRGDFCSGTSSTSSHMAHGGIRYLENGEFRLVNEAVKERNRMLENAPHLVQPLPTVIPIFKIFSGLLNAPLKFLNILDKPSERGALVIKIGLLLYDSFTRKQKTVPKHQFFGRKETLKRFPSLNSDVKFSALYFDGQLLSPERMTVELILDGEDEGGHAKALNYAELKSLNGGNAVIKDELTGEQFYVHPKIIINAAGPWVDGVNEMLGFKKKYIGGTKGSHLVIDNPQLRKAIGESEFFFENKDGRIVLLLPFYDKVIIGTSDLPIENPDVAKCTGEEEDYFIDLVKRVFPTIPISKNEIVFRFSGVRPLEYMFAKTTGQITRDHSIKTDSIDGIDVFSLVGGKWTSYRAFSEQVANVTMDDLNKKRQYSTESLPIRGGENFPHNLIELNELIELIRIESGLETDYCHLLVRRYGTKAMEVAKFIKQRKGKPLKSISSWNASELSYIIEIEKPIHLDDIFLRRSSIGWLGEISNPVVEEFAQIMAKACGWSQEMQKREVEHVKRIFFEFHGVIIK